MQSSSENLFALIQGINQGMDIIISITFGALLLFLILRYTYQRVIREGVGRGVYLGVIFGLFLFFLAAIIYFLPHFLAAQFPDQWLKQSQKFTFFIPERTEVFKFRWITLYTLLLPVWYLITHRHSGVRGVISVAALLTIFLTGWTFNRWIGIFFFSLPLLTIFFIFIDRLAQVIFPVSIANDNTERWRRTNYFLFYLFGVQYPFWMAESKAGREFKKPINGDFFKGLGNPGMVWTWSHQVAGLSSGIEFIRVEGPGLIYSDTFERPIALVDLRTQLRTSTIDAVSKDGVSVPVVVFMAFGIDRERWPRQNWKRKDYAPIRYLFSDRQDLDHPNETYPYASYRIQYALSTMGIMLSNEHPHAPSNYFWDEWVISQIEHRARQVVADRNIDELWRPVKHGLDTSALDEMSEEMTIHLEPHLSRFGVKLFTARIVNFNFEKDSDIVRQQIKTWKARWNKKIVRAEADIEVIYREEIEKAHTYAKSILLDSIANSLDSARAINPDLPKHVIAQYYIHALEEFIKKQPGMDEEAMKKRLENIKQLLLFRTEGND